MNIYIEKNELGNYIANQKEAVKKMLANINKDWVHSNTIKKILTESLKELNNIYKEPYNNKIIKHERKIEKYLDWIEVYRLANYHFSKYMSEGISYSEGLFSTLLSLSSMYTNKRKIKSIGVIGCGPGRSVLDFSYAYPDAIVYGLDYSIVSLILAKNIISTDKSNIEIIRRNYDNNPSGVIIEKIKGFNRKNCKWGLFDLTKSTLKKQFDIVVCSNVINLMPNHNKAIVKIYEMLKNGGYLIYADLTGWRLDRNSEQTLLCNQKTIKENFEKIGFETIECFDGGPYIEQENNSSFTFYKESYYIGRKNVNNI